MRPARWLAGLLLALLALPAAAGAAQSLAPRELGPATAAGRAYLAELRTEAARRGLWERRQWHTLLHYKPAWIGVESEADGYGFFFAADGRTDPRAELMATLAAFFSAEDIPPGEMPPQCAFPARYHWLDAQLDFDGERLPRLECPRFRRWRAALDPERVTLVFASYFFNSPSSMFGHTLLRLDKRGRSENQRLLDYAISYGAATGEEPGLLWAMKGVLGGYRGYVTLLPYYAKVKEYSDLEDRDLWEYRLHLAPEKLERLLRHTWELGQTWFDYYFFDENCSYHLLTLLEAADPSLRLTERFGPWTLPTETLRAVLGQPGLVSEVNYRPSRTSQLEAKLSRLPPARRRWVYDLAQAPQRSASEAFRGLPVAQRALALEGAVDVRRLRAADGGTGADGAGGGAVRELLLARSRLAYRRPRPEMLRRPPPPHHGHDTSRVFLGGGGQTGDATFYEVGLQPTFHDLMAREEGYAANSELTALSLRLRYEPAAEAARVERFTLVDIVSLYPVSRVEWQASWKVSAGWERRRDLRCGACAPFVLDGGIGFAAESRAWRRETWFAFAEPALHVDGLFDEDYRLGAGGSAGVLLEVTEHWRAALVAGQTVFFAGDTDQERVVEQGSVRNRYALGRNLDLRLDWRAVEAHREVALGLSVFF